MPTHKSPEKRMRQTKTRTARNRGVKSRLKTEIKKLRSSGARAEAEPKLRVVSSLLDKAVKAGVIHKRTVARQKSRLSTFVNRLKSD